MHHFESGYLRFLLKKFDKISTSNFQDELEFGYIDSPHHGFPVVLDSPRDRGLKDFPYDELLVRLLLKKNKVSRILTRYLYIPFGDNLQHKCWKQSISSSLSRSLNHLHVLRALTLAMWQGWPKEKTWAVWTHSVIWRLVLPLPSMGKTTPWAESSSEWLSLRTFVTGEHRTQGGEDLST